jgi:hypothetical protein
MSQVRIHLGYPLTLQFDSDKQKGLNQANKRRTFPPSPCEFIVSKIGVAFIKSSLHHHAGGRKYTRFNPKVIQIKKGNDGALSCWFPNLHFPSFPKKKGEAISSFYAIHYTSLMNLVNKKGSIGITNTPLVNVGEEGLSPHKLKNEKVINYSS